MSATPEKIMGRDMGLVGRLVRLLAGILPLPLVIRSLLAVPAPERVTFAATLLLTFILIGAIYFAVFYLLRERWPGRYTPWLPTVIFYGPVFAVAILDLGPLAFQLGLSLYIALSLLVAVAIDYGGCEMVALPSLLLKRRHVVYCPWNAIDVVEDAMVAQRTPRGALYYLSLAILILVGGYYLLALFGLFEILGLEGFVDRRGVLLFLIPVGYLLYRAWSGYRASASRSTPAIRRYIIAALILLFVVALALG